MQDLLDFTNNCICHQKENYKILKIKIKEMLINPY